MKSTLSRSEREMVVSRLIAAPRDLVFEAWTRPEHVVRWWGPDGFTTTILEMDVRPGGVWRLIMHGPDGVDYYNHIVFLEVAAPERLVYKHVPEGNAEPVSFQTTVTFVERGGRTEVTMRALFESTAQLEHVIKRYGADTGAMQTLDRLAELLRGMVERPNAAS